VADAARAYHDAKYHRHDTIEFMSLFASLTVGVIGAAVAIKIIWRVGSRHRAMPCPVWLHWLVGRDNPFARTHGAAFIAEHLDVAPGMTVLDAGCGPGRVTLPLAKRAGAEGLVVAMDLQAGMLTHARMKAEAAGLANIEYLHAGLGEGRLEHGRFQRAALVTVLGEIPDREAALAELFTALAPGGRLAVVEVIFDPHFQRRSMVNRLTAAAGFREGAFFGNRFAYLALFEKPAEANEVT